MWPRKNKNALWSQKLLFEVSRTLSIDLGSTCLSKKKDTYSSCNMIVSYIKENKKMAHRSPLVATATQLLSYHGPFLASQKCKAKVRKGEGILRDGKYGEKIEKLMEFMGEGWDLNCIENTAN